MVRLEAVAEHQLWGMRKGPIAYTPGLQIANLKYSCYYVKVADITTPFSHPNSRLARSFPLPPLPRNKSGSQPRYLPISEVVNYNLRSSSHLTITSAIGMTH